METRSKPPSMVIDGSTFIIASEHGEEHRFPRYEYRSLSSTRTIRLLKVIPQQQQAPQSRLRSYELVEYELPSTDGQHRDVSNSPYVAVSYSWGTTVADTPLMVVTQGHQQILPVTASAWDAIDHHVHHMRLKGEMIWIDQVCIDQSNQDERAQQVKIMGDIYRRCRHGMIWLGLADAGTTRAYALLRRLHQDFDQYPPFSLLWHEVANLSHAQIRMKLASELGVDLVPPNFDPGWVEIARLLTRDWFSRLWTFQEGVLSYRRGETFVCCGQYNIPIRTFTLASMLLGRAFGSERIDSTDIEHSRGRMTVSEIAHVANGIDHGHVFSLHGLLVNNYGRNCSDQNDRVYAFFGLRDQDSLEFPITINYRQSPQDLYVQVARQIIRSTRSLRICADNSERMKGQGLKGLPSWTPDWTTAPTAQGIEVIDGHEPFFDAAKGRRHDYEDVSETPNMLKAKGRIVDRITTIIDFDIYEISWEGKHRAEIIRREISVLVAAIASSNWGWDADQIIYAIFRTITLDGRMRGGVQRLYGLPPGAWEQSACAKILGPILTGVRPLRRVGFEFDPVDPVRWMHAFSQEVQRCRGRRFALLKNNRVALVPYYSRVDDSIVILHGSTLPFVMRGSEEGTSKMVGTCFVNGLMYGEAVDWDEGDTFHIN